MRLCRPGSASAPPGRAAQVRAACRRPCPHAARLRAVAWLQAHCVQPNIACAGALPAGGMRAHAEHTWRGEGVQDSLRVPAAARSQQPFYKGCAPGRVHTLQARPAQAHALGSASCSAQRQAAACAADLHGCQAQSACRRRNLLCELRIDPWQQSVKLACDARARRSPASTAP